MRKIKKYLVKFLDKFTLDTKFNRVILTIIELPLVITSFILKKYALLLYGAIGIALLGLIVKKCWTNHIIKRELVDPLKEFKKGVDATND